MNNGLVSVIIPTHNVASYIKVALDSVLAQTYPEIEICIADDGSTDTTRDIVQMYVEEYPGKIKLFSEQHVGCAGTMRNVAMRHARGKYIAFLDADDIWKLEKLEIQVQRLLEMEADFCYADAEFLGGDKNGHLFSEYSRFISGKRIFPDLVLTNCIVNSSVIFKKKIIADVGLLREQKIYRNIEDYEYWLRIALTDARFVYIDFPLLYYRIHAQQHTLIQGRNDVSLLFMYGSFLINGRIWVLRYGIYVLRMVLIYLKNIFNVWILRKY